MAWSTEGRSASLFFAVGTLTAVVAVLYFAQPVLVPLTLSAFLAFLLTPLVHRLQRLRVPRFLAVLIVALGAFLALGGLGTLIGGQIASLAKQLPRYEKNIRERLATVREAIPVIERAAKQIEDLKQSAEGAGGGGRGRDESSAQGGAGPEGGAGSEGRADSSEGGGAGQGGDPEGGAGPADGDPEQGGGDEEEEPVPVKVEPQRSPVEQVFSYLLPALNPLATSGLVIVFTLLMLLQPFDLGERLGRLLGPGQVERTTQMLDETGRRIGRYLLMQLLIATIYGALVTVGLLLFGLPGALLWGLLALLLRFIPYVGPWVGAGLPIVLALAVFPDWATPLGIAAMFVTLELFANNVLEPWLYGTSTGLSPVAVILAMIFWGWLWGGVGLLLAVPMTVCLVVSGKYVPALRVFPALLGDRWTLAPHAVFYQLLATGQQNEARRMARVRAARASWLTVYDELWLPALALAGAERDDRWTDTDQALRTMETAGEVARDAVPRQHEVLQEERAGAIVSSSSLTIRCVPTTDTLDRLGARALAQLLQDLGYRDAAFCEREALASVALGLGGPLVVVVTVGPGLQDAAAVCRALPGQRVLLLVPREERTGRSVWLRWRWWWHRPAAEPVRSVEGALEAIGAAAARSGGEASEPAQAARVRGRPAA